MGTLRMRDLIEATGVTDRMVRQYIQRGVLPRARVDLMAMGCRVVSRQFPSTSSTRAASYAVGPTHRDGSHRCRSPDLLIARTRSGNHSMTFRSFGSTRVYLRPARTS